MAKTSETSDSNNILKTVIIVLIVIGIAYLIYYLYYQYATKDNTQSYTNDPFVPPHSQHSQNVMTQPTIIEQPSIYQQPPPAKFEREQMSNFSYGMDGSASGQGNPMMEKIEMLKKGKLVGEDAVEHFSNNDTYSEERNHTSFPKEQLKAEELLPQDNYSLWAQVNPSGEGSLKDRNFLQSGYHIGINTVGQTLRNANLQLRSEPPCPQIKVSPWLQSSIEPDVSRRPMEIGGCA